MKAYKCGQVMLAFQACALMKVEREEERQVEREVWTCRLSLTIGWLLAQSIIFIIL